MTRRIVGYGTGFYSTQNTKPLVLPSSRIWNSADIFKPRPTRVGSLC